MKKNWFSVVFISGEEADEMFERIEEQDDGITPNWFERELIETLQEWDEGDFGFTYRSSPSGKNDEVFKVNASKGEVYEVSYNISLSYCGLCLIADEI